MSKVSEVAFEDLNVLLKASSKQQVIELCEDAYECREERVPAHVAKRSVELLGIDSNDASKLASSLCSLIKNAIFHGFTTSDELVSFFPENFHKNLAELLSKIIMEHMPVWKSRALSSLVALPRLSEFDWRVDLKMASGRVARMNEPTCILHLKILDTSRSPEQKDRLLTLNVELTKEKLDAILNGLGRIRDQLSAVAKK